MFDYELFFGRFHPLIVHLPIGFLALAILFKLLDQRVQSSTYRAALKLTLLLSAIGAVITCVTGLLLSWSSTYPASQLDRHMWAGIVLTIATIAWYLVEFQWRVPAVFRLLTLGLVAVFLLITGHRGGVLTHGETYLWEGLPVSWQQFLGHDATASESIEFEITNLDSALVYEDIVMPLFEARCVTCHGDRKQKGDLRLDSRESILQGGDSGDPLIAVDLEHSKLYEVLTLPLSDDLHMPPKGKPQLTDFQVEVLGVWIKEGGQPGKRVMQYTDKGPLLSWYEDLIAGEKLYANPLIPGGAVSSPDEELVVRLQDSGVLVQRVGMDNNYLEMSFINIPVLSAELIREAAQLNEQVIWMDISGHALGDAHLDQLVRFSRLTDLNLARSILPENGLVELSALDRVQVLNLTGTDLSGAGIDALSDWPGLRKVFTYQSGISAESVERFTQSNPEIEVDTGGYRLPVVARDTIVFRRK